MNEPKVVKMERPGGLSKKEKLKALFMQIVERVKLKMETARIEKPERYNFGFFLKAVFSDLLTIVSFLVLGTVAVVVVVFVVIFTMIENGIRSVTFQVKSFRKRNFKMKKV